jgi:hypothetical protein
MQARIDAIDSPVTCHTCAASPTPVTPSPSVTSTSRLRSTSVRRSAVTNGVCRRAVSSRQRTERI